MIELYNKWSKAIQRSLLGASNEEHLKKMIDAHNLERLHYEAMAFKYYRAMLASAKGQKRQAAKIKRLKSAILDIEFANQYQDGGPVNKVEGTVMPRGEKHG